MSLFNGRAVISGVGLSEVGRRIGRSPVALAAEACLAAVSDAGLDLRYIDGVATHPGEFGRPGYSGAGVYHVKDVWGLSLQWYLGGAEQAGQLGPVAEASMAVSSGLATHVLCFRSTWEGTAQAGAGSRGRLLASDHLASGENQWRQPLGLFSPAHYFAMYARRYMHQYGLTREQLAQVALVDRANAALNSNAIYTSPMTLDDYLGGRMVTDPLCL